MAHGADGSAAPNAVGALAQVLATLKAPAVPMGFGLPGDNLHAPNEKFALVNFGQGIEAAIRLFGESGG